MLPFLKYINDPSHKWHCCFGVPYATHIWQVGDASSINGSFKMNLTKAKCEYIKIRGAPRFEPTDIVPLVNKAFPPSFGNQKSAINAVAQRGWNPLNFNLLTTLPDKMDVVNLTGTTSSSSTQRELPTLLNVSAGSANYYLDLLIEEEMKNEGRKKKFEDIKKEQKTRDQKIENLKKITKVSSSQLAARNHYVLDENVLELVAEKNAAQEAAQIAAEERKKALEDKRAGALKDALRKFTLCPNGLTVPEMKALVIAASKSTDSPVKKKKQELQEQLYHEPRYGRVKELAKDFELTLATNAGENTSSTDAAQALLAISVQGPIIPM